MHKLSWKTIAVLAGFLFGGVLVATIGIGGMRQFLGVSLALYLLAWGAYAMVAAQPREELQNRFLAVTVALGVGVTMLEAPGLTGLVDYKMLFLTSGDHLWERPGYLPDPELLFKTKPYFSRDETFRRGNMGERLCLPVRAAVPHRLQYDRHGFRNETDLMAADIAVIGDSYVESFMMPTPQLMTTVLAQLQGRTVANLGISGYGPAQELAVLKRYALPLHPKTVVWVFYEGNDWHDLYAYDEAVKQVPSVGSRSGWLVEHSFLLNAVPALLRTMKGCVPDPYAEGIYGVVASAAGADRQLFGQQLSPVPKLVKEQEALDRFIGIVADAYRAAAHDQAGFVFVFAPTKFRVYQDLAQFEASSNATRATWTESYAGLPERVAQRVRAIASDISWVDLTQDMREAVRTGHPVFIADDTHWTVEGNRVAAESIHRALNLRSR